MATAAELRRLREEQSIFAPLYEAARQQQSELAAQGRRPVFGGLLSKEPVYGTDTLRYEGIGNMLAGLLSPAAKAVDAPISAYRGTIPQEDMISEALGVGGLAMAGGGAVGVPRGAVGANAADLRRQANIDRFGYDPNEAPKLSGFDAYLRRVNPSDKRIPEENRPNLMMGDMYGMLPRDAEYVSDIGAAEIYRTPDGSYYATAYNPDLGEMDVVGYAIKGDKETDLQVVSEMQGKGIGGELQYLFRKENPDAPTGGLTEAGEASLLKTYNKLRDDGVVAANASKSAGLLTTAASEAQDMAKRILDLRAQGRASEVTDEMMEQADPQYMFANTPLPMDEASRIARAEAAGFDVGNPVFHGGASGIKAMDADVSEGKDFDTGVWTTSDRYNANRYAGSRTEGVPKINDQQNWSIYDDRGSVYPLLAKTSGYGETNFRGRNWGDAPEGAIIRGGGQPSQRISEVREDWRAWPYTSEAVRAARDTGRSGLVIKDVVDIGPNFPHKDHIGLGSEISDDVVAIDPSTLRSRFARFDPEFAHLSNLSAANVSPIGGLLAQSGANQQSGPVAPNLIDEYLKSLQARR